MNLQQSRALKGKPPILERVKLDPLSSLRKPVGSLCVCDARLCSVWFVPVIVLDSLQVAVDPGHGGS